MKILILDDEKARHDLYVKKYSKDTVMCTYSLGAFREALKAFNPDLIHLDYDLYLDKDYKVGDSGLVAARIIKNMLLSGLITTHKIIIHSMNETGRALLYDKLMDIKGLEVVVCPFGREI